MEELLMIITVTMNPAVDKTVSVKNFVYGGLNRINNIEYDAGGKGINVSKAIASLGGKSVAIGFMGGNNGKFIEKTLTGLGIETDFVHIDGETRTNTKIAEENGNITELNESGFTINSTELDELLKKIENYAEKDNLFVLSGSVPQGVDKTIYQKITEIVHAKCAKVIADADGELFSNALKAKPDYIKPNKDELLRYANLKTADEKNILNLLEKLNSDGIENIVLSMGSEGAYFVMDGKIVKYQAPTVAVKSTVGAGDTMVAVLALAHDNKMPFEDTAKMCIAASSAAVTTNGTKPPDKELVEKLVERVVVEEIIT
jgi:1-phosphofructokinase